VFASIISTRHISVLCATRKTFSAAMAPFSDVPRWCTFNFWTTRLSCGRRRHGATKGQLVLATDLAVVFAGFAIAFGPFLHQPIRFDCLKMVHDRFVLRGLGQVKRCDRITTFCFLAAELTLRQGAGFRVFAMPITLRLSAHIVTIHTTRPALHDALRCMTLHGAIRLHTSFRSISRCFTGVLWRAIHRALRGVGTGQLTLSHVRVLATRLTRRGCAFRFTILLTLNVRALPLALRRAITAPIIIGVRSDNVAVLELSDFFSMISDVLLHQTTSPPNTFNNFQTITW